MKNKISSKYITDAVATDEEVANEKNAINSALNSITENNEIDKNSRDTENRKRSNHTGTQQASTISDFASTVLSTALTSLSTASNSIISTADSILTALGKIQKQLFFRPVVIRAGVTVENARMWVGETTVSGSGAWSVNYSSAGFTEVFAVIAQASATGTSAGDSNYASVNTSTITTTSASGRASNAVTVGLLVSTVNQSASNGLVVKVVVWGK